MTFWRIKILPKPTITSKLVLLDEYEQGMKAKYPPPYNEKKKNKRNPGSKNKGNRR